MPSGHAVMLHLVNVASAAVGSVLAALALPRIQPEQHHQAVHKSLASHTPELMVSAIRAGPHNHLGKLIIVPLAEASDKTRQHDRLHPDVHPSPFFPALGYTGER